MKKLYLTIIIMISALLPAPLAVYGQSNQTSKGAPPVSQALVPEGDFALKLAPALGLGTPNSEAQAEDMLTSVGIAPKNGWIADYPVTPIVVGEVEDAVNGAADAHKLPIGKDDALTAFRNLTVEFGVAVVPGGPGQYAENQPQPDSALIDNYYYEEGPPVVTYYPPPWDYSYLYAWVPYPFWWGGFFFSGFFCLHDFHRFHHNHLISNHFVDPVTRAVARVDPVSHTAVTSSRTATFNSTTTRNSATSIFNRSANFTGSRTFSHSTSSATSSGMNRSSSQSIGRSSGSASSSGRPSGSSSSFSRSSGSPSSGGSSSCANCHGSSGSFGRSGGSSSSGGFSGSRSSAGFSGGHSSGGFSGGHSSGGSSGGGFSGGHGGGFSGGRGGGGSHGGGRGR